MERKTTARITPATALETLEQVVSVLNPEIEPGELAAQMVRVLAASGRLDGARRWRVVNGTPTSLPESGGLPAAGLAGIEKILKGKASSKNGKSRTWLLGRQ